MHIVDVPRISSLSSAIVSIRRRFHHSKIFDLSLFFLFCFRRDKTRRIQQWAAQQNHIGMRSSIDNNSLFFLRKSIFSIKFLISSRNFLTKNNFQAGTWWRLKSIFFLFYYWHFKDWCDSGRSRSTFIGDFSYILTLACILSFSFFFSWFKVGPVHRSPVSES